MLLLTTTALAHSGLLSPPPRYPSDGLDDNKACPCGVGLSGRLCEVASDRSDPDRSDDITTFQPGETILMRWREVIGHAGRWRVAFDLDGADMADFNANILLDIEDPDGDAGNVGDGNLWEVQVTLPTTPCDNCTLQLVQMMDGDTSSPVADPIGRSSYYQCSDIVLAGEPLDPPADTETGGGCSTLGASLWTALPGLLGRR
ncbi:MAG: lytic polysaccharide monooxygenase [Myxococcales bacterium]|nr:lytic polysaccharide monooxygenase [Myxococcales bacterium]